MSLVIKGKTWIFGNNINTDLIAPGAYKFYSWKDKKPHVLEALNPDFHKNVRDGDIMIVGRNFGCGSSREEAVENLLNLGIKCIIGESFGRIFFRNCIALGLPILNCPGVSSIFKQEGDIAIADIDRAVVKNGSRSLMLNAKPLSNQIIDIIKEGGLITMLKN